MSNNSGEIAPISKNIKNTDSKEVKELKEAIYYARLSYHNAKGENQKKIGKELDELLAELETLQPKKSLWEEFKKKHGIQGGKRETRKQRKKGRVCRGCRKTHKQRQLRKH